MAALVDEVAGEQGLPCGVVDGHAAVRVTGDMEHLQSLGYVENLHCPAVIARQLVGGTR